MRLWKYYSFPSSPLLRIIIYFSSFVNQAEPGRCSRCRFCRNRKFRSRAGRSSSGLARFRISPKNYTTMLSLDAVRVVGFIKIANSVLAQVAHPPDSLVSNKSEELRLSLDAVRVVGFIETSVCAVLLQVQPVPPLLQSWQLLRRCPRRCLGLA